MPRADLSGDLGDLLAGVGFAGRGAWPQVAIAAQFSVWPVTINKHIRDIRQLLDQAGYAIQAVRPT